MQFPPFYKYPCRSTDWRELLVLHVRMDLGCALNDYFNTMAQESENQKDGPKAVFWVAETQAVTAARRPWNATARASRPVAKCSRLSARLMFSRSFTRARFSTPMTPTSV